MRYLLLLILACEPFVTEETVCDEAGTASAMQLFMACTDSGLPRSVSVDDDTVDLAEWVAACGEQARTIACQRVKVAR